MHTVCRVSPSLTFNITKYLLISKFIFHKPEGYKVERKGVRKESESSRKLRKEVSSTKIRRKIAVARKSRNGLLRQSRKTCTRNGKGEHISSSPRPLLNSKLARKQIYVNLYRVREIIEQSYGTINECLIVQPRSGRIDSTSVEWESLRLNTASERYLAGFYMAVGSFPLHVPTVIRLSFKGFGLDFLTPRYLVTTALKKIGNGKEIDKLCVKEEININPQSTFHLATPMRVAFQWVMASSFLGASHKAGVNARIK
jgi:hypothetical protein